MDRQSVAGLGKPPPALRWHHSAARHRFDHSGCRHHVARAGLAGRDACRVAERLRDEIATADGVVNATPIGMSGFPGNPVPAEALRPDHWVADVIYSPIKTELIATAAAKGARVLTGGGMCVHQAVDAFRLFTGITPDVARMHRVFNEALAARDAVR